MDIPVVVTVEVGGDPQTRQAEQRFEQEAVAAIRNSVSKDKTITVLDVSLLDFEHCKWVRDLGMPISHPAVPEGIDLFEDGSWRVPSGMTKESIESGSDFASLIAYIARRDGGSSAPVPSSN